MYPTRTRSARGVTLALGAVWSVVMLLLILQIPQPSKGLAWVSLVFPVYYAGLSLALHARRSRTGTAEPQRG